MRKRDAIHALDVAARAAQEAAADRKPDLEIVGRDDDGRVRIGTAADRPSARRRAAPSCRDAADCLKISRTGPRSTMRPCCMTQTSSAILRTMPRSCVMNSIAMSMPAAQIAQQRQDLRLHRHVERRRRLVRDEQLSAGWRAPSRSLRADAARLTIDAGTRRAARPDRGCRPRSEARSRGRGSSHARRRGSRESRRPACRSDAAD